MVLELGRQVFLAQGGSLRAPSSGHTPHLKIETVRKVRGKFQRKTL